MTTEPDATASAQREPAGVSALWLGLPALALALAITTASALVPLSIERQGGSPLAIGLVVSGEGLVALLLPLWIGPLSDRTRSPLGGRLPFVIAGAVLGATALALLPLVHSFASIAALMLAFYVGYFIYYPAYRALYPELVPEARFARAQGVQSLLREVGLVLALAGAPLLYTASPPAPFVAGAAALALVTTLFVLRLRRHVTHVPAPTPARTRRLPDAPVRRVLLANALFELALSGLKSFIVLFVVVGTGRTPAAASGLMSIVAVVAVVAAPAAGWLGDRFGPTRVTRAALLVYASGMLLPTFTQSLWVLVPAMPLVGFGGTVVMTLSYTLVARAAGTESPGTSAGWYEFSRGLGVILGPIVTGAAIDGLRPIFPATRGYAALWLVQAMTLLLAVPLLPRERARRAPLPSP